VPARQPHAPPAHSELRPGRRTYRSRLPAAAAGQRARRRAAPRPAAPVVRPAATGCAEWAARLVGPLRDHEQAQQALLGAVQVRQQRALPARGAGPVTGRAGALRARAAAGESGPGRRAAVRRAAPARRLPAPRARPGQAATAGRLAQPGPRSAARVPQATQARPCCAVRARAPASQRFPVLALSAVVPHKLNTRDVAASGSRRGLSGNCRRPRALCFPSERLQAPSPHGAGPLPGSARQRGGRARRRAHLSASGSLGRLSASCRRPPYACSTTTSSTWRRSVSRSAPLSSGSCPAAIASTRRRPRSSTAHDYAMPRPQKLRQAWGLQY
jgi:hypothetical protein